MGRRERKQLVDSLNRNVLLDNPELIQRNSMKRFWMIWITIMTLIGLGFGGYLYVHTRNDRSHRNWVYSYCSQKAFKESDEDSIYPDTIKTEYSYRYSDCIRTH